MTESETQARSRASTPVNGTGIDAATADDHEATKSSTAASSTDKEGAPPRTAELSFGPVSSVPTLATERLLLRPFRPADAPAVFAYSSDPRIGHDAGWPAHRTIEDSLSFINDITSQGHVWAIVPHGSASDDMQHDAPIGSIGLIPDPAREYDKVLMLGYAIGASFWGKGFTTEATKAVLGYGFEELGLEAVSCTCYPWNKASKHVIDKCGFEFEGTRHLAEIGQDGVPEDFLCHILTKARWQKPN